MGTTAGSTQTRGRRRGRLLVRSEPAGIVLMVGVLGLTPWAASCFVDGLCRGDEDCDPPMVCDEARACVLECQSDGDCSEADICRDNRCLPAPGCVGCRFPNADAICLHGVCSRGDCQAGWVDANDADSDGCEYFCTPTGAELCDEVDNDCDTRIDEGYELSSEVANCGECGNQCAEADHASPVCHSGRCGFVCDPGWYDSNGLKEDGCESRECVPAEEICDGMDNDCDDEVDEGFDKALPESCGELCAVCDYEHADALCVDGECAMGPCDETWHDINEWDGDGCEYPCEVAGPEVCDGDDDDCDGDIDEGLLCCGDDMVAIEDEFCIDIYEASLAMDGDGALYAVSRAGVEPFWDRHLTAEQAETYCQVAGKRLCNASEWTRVCRGPDELSYCYGDTYEPTTCNGIDAFGPGNHQLADTGAFGDCTNAYGIFDINGNVWEMADDGLVRGGAYNCLDSATLHECTFSIEPSRVIAIGFRCCR